MSWGVTGLQNRGRCPGQCPGLLSPQLRGRGCCCPAATSLGSAGEAGGRTGTRQSRVLPARGCSRGSSPGTAPSPAARPPAGARPGRSTPAARASPGAAPGSGSHSQSLRVLKRHNTRTEMEGKRHQHAVQMEGNVAWGDDGGRGNSPACSSVSVWGLRAPCLHVESPSAGPVGAPQPTRSLPAAHHDHEGVPGGGEDLGTLIPAVVPPQLGQKELRLDLRDRCRL